MYSITACNYPQIMIIQWLFNFDGITNWKYITWLTFCNIADRGFSRAVITRVLSKLTTNVGSSRVMRKDLAFEDFGSFLHLEIFFVGNLYKNYHMKMKVIHLHHAYIVVLELDLKICFKNREYLHIYYKLLNLYAKHENNTCSSVARIGFRSAVNVSRASCLSNQRVSQRFFKAVPEYSGAYAFTANLHTSEPHCCTNRVLKKINMHEPDHSVCI